MKLTYSSQKGTPGHCMVAQVWADGRNAAEIEPTDDPDEATAMARMFAAAPDLLAACEDAEREFRWLDNIDPHTRAVADYDAAVAVIRAKIGAAIAKAKGLTPDL